MNKTLLPKSIRRIGGQAYRRLHAFNQAMSALLEWSRKGRLFWLLYFVDQRDRFRLDALYTGIEMNRKGAGNVFNFRRNIHRIEKGLVRSHLKPVFAEDYILETVHNWAQFTVSGECDENTLAWGASVLDRYFGVCEHKGRVADAYQVFHSHPVDNRQPNWYPYPAESRPPLAVEFSDLHQLALRRRSIRYYLLDRFVEFQTVQQAMTVAALSPSACNRQAFKFLFYNDKDIVDEICNIPGGFAGFQAPSIVVVVGNYRGYFEERDANVPIIDASLATMAFTLALETLGLSSVCINWPSLPDRDEAIRKLIHLEPDEFVVILVGVGYAAPEGKVPYSTKRDITVLISHNERIIHT